MNIQAAAIYMEQGYRVKRAIWLGEDDWISEITTNAGVDHLCLNDLISDDWEIILDGIIDNTGYVRYK